MIGGLGAAVNVTIAIIASSWGGRVGFAMFAAGVWLTLGLGPALLATGTALMAFARVSFVARVRRAGGA